ncbi:hypothetical protein M5689_004466 [Euphorbia peplus]|nr:hypothetical protein M5689_004466 [Euphorbia peplus]
MTFSKRLMISTVLMLVVISIQFVEKIESRNVIGVDVESRYADTKKPTPITPLNQLGNGAIAAGDPTCKGESCLPPPSNHYDRGCSQADRCRGGN